MICHPYGGLRNAPPATISYCNEWFLPRYGAFNSSAVHAGFVREYCTERLSRDYERNDVSFGELARSDRLLFVGVAEDFFAAECLFLYQAGRFPREHCSCDAARRIAARGNADELTLRGLTKAINRGASSTDLASRGVPDLRLSREAFERRSPKDVALYREARALFDARVRLAERRVSQRFSACVGM